MVFLICGLLVGSAGIGAAALRVSTDNRIFYGPDNPYYQDYLEFEAEFTHNDNILFVLSASYSVLEGDFPEAIRWANDTISALNHVTRADSLASYPHPHTEDGELVVQSILDWACPTTQPCRTDATSVLTKPHLVNRVISPDLRTTGVLATVSIERGAVGTIEALHSETQRIRDEFLLQFPNHQMYVTGGVPMMAAFASETANDLSLILPSALIVISILLAMVLGSLRLAGSILIVGIASIITTLGLAGWTGHILNNATSTVPLIVFTLVVTSSMHIAFHFSRNTHADTHRLEAISQAKASLTSSLVPITISAATSAVSLSSLWFVDSPPLSQLGLMSAFGVIAGWAFTIVLLPLLLVSVRQTSDTHLSRNVQAWINSYARRVEIGELRIRAPTIGFIFCASGLLLLTVNEDFVRFFDESVPFRIHTDRATELMAGPNHIEAVLRNPEGSVFDTEYVAYVETLTREIRRNVHVANAHSFSDVMSDVSEAFSEKSLHEIESNDELAQLFLIYELSLQQGQSNVDLVNSVQDKSRISVLLKETTSNEIQDLEQELYGFHAARKTGYELLITGENIPVAHLSWMNIRSMVTGIFLSLTFTAIALGMVFRSVRLGSTALIATVTPVLAGFGIWGWINGDIGLAATAIIALTIGVVVDDATHYLYRFLDAKDRLELDSWAAAAYACHRAGGAIVSTSVVMGIGLSLLLFSSFQVNSSFGAVACLIIVAALIFNIAIVPRLAVWATPSHSTHEEPPT